MHRPYVWIGLGTALVLVFVAAWLLLSLGWVVQSLHKEVRGRLHRELSVRGGAHIEFTPGLAIRLDDVAISNPEGMEGSFVSAPSLRIRLDLAELLSRQIDRSDFTLIEPAINLSRANRQHAARQDCPGARVGQLHRRANRPAICHRGCQSDGGYFRSRRNLTCGNYDSQWPIGSP
jgi:uncharacterized protein involved in outer membrane biogenesis